MKRLIFFAVLYFPCAVVFAQVKKQPPATAKPATAEPVMKNAVDSFSYAIGLSIANFYKAQGVEHINNQLVIKALTDVQNNKAMLNDNQVNSCIISYMQVAKSKKAEANKMAGIAFLEENKKKPGVVVLPSGLQYQVLREGDGPKPTAADQVKVHYTGTNIDGSVFESSIERGEPLTIGLRSVIAGWTEALQMMPAGSKWRLFIPSDLAYGDNSPGPDIKEGATLIFDLELLEIVKQ